MKTQYQWWYILISSGVFFLIVKEAWVLPLTHDEGNTIYCSQTSIWDIITYADVAPNNHILNTLLIKFNQWIFGENLFFARLHNTLSGLIYIIFTLRILNRLHLDSWLKFTGFLLLVFQPYLLDFFSVTRGYGLSIALMMVSFYYFFKRLESHKTSDLFNAWLFLSIGVYANFTLLNVYVPFFFVLAAHSFYQNRKFFIKEMLWTISMGLILLAISIVPLYKMISTSQFVYWGSSGFLQDTGYPLIKALRSGVHYKYLSTHSLGWVIGLLVLFTVSAAGYLSWKKKSDNTNLRYFTFLWVGILVYNHLQFYILKVPFLNARTALFLLPIFVLVFVIAFNFIVKHKPYFALPFLAVMSSLMVFHMISGFKVDENYEWQYDRHTFKLIQEIQKIKENEGQVPTLNCYWIYYQSLSYHIPKIASNDIELAPWGTKVQTDTVFQYYYTEFSELESLNEEYEIIKDFGDAYLLKRK